MFVMENVKQHLVISGKKSKLHTIYIVNKVS